MTIKQRARWALRAATARDHDLVDQAFAGFDLSDRRQYTSFLASQAQAFLPVEAGIDVFDIETALPDWQGRRRSGALTADLADLGTPTENHFDIPVFDCLEAALGAVYVLEGSRLGGSMLLRTVPASLPRRFLGAGDSSLWRKLIEVLDATLLSSDQLTVAIDAARATFARFEVSARDHRKDVCH